MNSISDKLIKILSLGIGLAIGIVLIAKVCFELSYDSFYKDVDRIYMIKENFIMQNEPKDYSRTSRSKKSKTQVSAPMHRPVMRLSFSS